MELPITTGLAITPVEITTKCMEAAPTFGDYSYYGIVDTL